MATAQNDGPSLTVLTLNVWDMIYISKKRQQRIRYLADYLKTCTEDVVLLQEVWVDKDAQQLITAGKEAGLQHTTHFRSGTFGAGLVTLSRHAITQYGFWQYAAAGSAFAFYCGDYYATKGVGWTRLSTPLGEVDVFNTHLHANYSHDYRVPVRFVGNATSGGVDQSDKWAGSMVPHDDYAAIRVSQLVELTQIVDLVNKGSSCPVVLAGDLNCKPETLEVDLLQLRLPYLRDAWATAIKRSSGTEAAVAAGGADEGLTHAVAWNSFKPRRQVPERIDYVWSDLSCKSAEVTLQVTPGGFSYSDHFAVRVELTPSKPQPDAADSEPKKTAAAPMVLGTKAVQPADNAQTGNDSSVRELAVQCNMPPEKVKATLLGTCALLEEGVISWGADASTKIAMGGCLLLTLLYCVVCLPIMIPSIQLRGLGLSAAVISSGFLCMLSLLLVMNGLIADYAQQRALANIYRHLRVYMNGMHVVPNRAGGFS